MRNDLSKLSVFQFYMKQLQEMWKPIFAITLAGIFTAIMAIGSPYLLKCITDVASLYVDNRQEGISHVMPYFALLVGLTFIEMVCYRMTSFLCGVALPPQMARIRTTMMTYVMGQSHHYFTNHFAGALTQKVHDMANSFNILTRRFFRTVLPNILFFTLAFSVFFYTNKTIGILIFVWLIIVTFLQYFLYPSYYAKIKKFAEKRSILTGTIVDILGNQSSVRLFSKRNYVLDSVYRDVQEQECNSHVQQNYSGEFVVSLMRLSAFIVCTLGIVVYSLWLWRDNVISAGDMIMIITASWKVVDMLGHLVWDIPEMMVEWGKAKQAWDVLTRPHTITDREDAKTLQVRNGEIAFENVEFHYNAENKLFNGKSITIPSGQKVGLVGESGAGKTTFVNLLLRLYDVEGGAITIDGQNIAEVTQDSLHEHITVIPQDPSLFHRSLMDNIRFAKRDATDEEVYEAARYAQIHDFILSLPKGYDTLVGERGIKLSGGQRQRVAIARAFLKDAPILVIDEGTSALDSDTESRIQPALYDLMEEKTTIVIAHRLSTLRHMDRIVVLDNGTIAEDGKHQDLMNKTDGIFAKLWAMQAGGFLPDKI